MSAIKFICGVKFFNNEEINSETDELVIKKKKVERTIQIGRTLKSAFVNFRQFQFNIHQ